MITILRSWFPGSAHLNKTHEYYEQLKTHIEFARSCIPNEYRYLGVLYVTLYQMEGLI